MDEQGWDRLLDAHPHLKRAVYQFMSLHDAAEVLDEVKPPHGDVAAEFLREVGNHLVRDAGLPDAFVDAMAAGKPPSLASAKREPS